MGKVVLLLIVFIAVMFVTAWYVDYPSACKVPGARASSSVLNELCIIGVR